MVLDLPLDEAITKLRTLEDEDDFYDEICDVPKSVRKRRKKNRVSDAKECEIDYPMAPPMATGKIY